MIKAVLLAAAAAVSAQSAKFAAVYSPQNATRFLTTCALATSDPTFYDTPEFLDEVCPDDEDPRSGFTFANIKVPQNSEILVGLSAQIELYTGTAVAGRKGSKSTALASAEGGVMLYACPPDHTGGNFTTCELAEPGFVTLSRRTQELEGVFGGVINECDVDPATLSFNIDDCDVDQESISLALNTLAAHHFNFLFVDLPSGEYRVKARFDTQARADYTLGCADGATFCDPAEDPEAGASALAAIGKYMMTVQQVAAVRNSLNSMDIIDLN